MDTTQLNDRLRDIFRAMPKAVAGGSTGWVNLANFGKELISNDIDFHVMGFAKLREFVESLDLFEIYKDITNALPVYYIRLKDITLSYQLPQSAVEKIRLQGLKFYVSGQNLYTFHDVSYWDPERGVDGIGAGIYPMTKTIVGGIEVTF